MGLWRVIIFLCVLIFFSTHPAFPPQVENIEKSSSLNWVEICLTPTKSPGSSCPFLEVRKWANLTSFIYDSLQIFEESCHPELVLPVIPHPSAFQTAKERNHLISFIVPTRESSTSITTCSVIGLSKLQFSHMQSGNKLLGGASLMGFVCKWLYKLGTMYIWRNGWSWEHCQTVGRREKTCNLSVPTPAPNHSSGPGQS